VGSFQPAISNACFHYQRRGAHLSVVTSYSLHGAQLQYLVCNGRVAISTQSAYLNSVSLSHLSQPIPAQFNSASLSQFSRSSHPPNQSKSVESIQANPTQSKSIQANPNQSKPIQTNPNSARQSRRPDSSCLSYGFTRPVVSSPPRFTVFLSHPSYDFTCLARPTCPATSCSFLIFLLSPLYAIFIASSILFPSCRSCSYSCCVVLSQSRTLRLAAVPFAAVCLAGTRLGVPCL